MNSMMSREGLVAGLASVACFGVAAGTSALLWWDEKCSGKWPLLLGMGTAGGLAVYGKEFGLERVVTTLIPQAMGAMVCAVKKAWIGSTPRENTGVIAQSNPDQCFFDEELAEHLVSYFWKKGHEKICVFNAGVGGYVLAFQRTQFTVVGIEGRKDLATYSESHNVDVATVPLQQMFRDAPDVVVALGVEDTVPEGYKKTFFDNLCVAKQCVVMSASNTVRAIQEMEQRGWKLEKEESLFAKDAASPVFFWLKESVMIFVNTKAS